MTKPQLYNHTAHTYRLASIFCFFLCFSFYPKYSYPSNLDKLIKQLTERKKTPSLVRLDYHEKKYQRDKKSSKKVAGYRQKIGGFQHAMWMLFQKIYSEEIKKERTELEKNNFITIEETINSLSNLQKKGIDIQTGDIIFTLPHQSSSYQIAKYAKSKYSHGGLIWIEEGSMSAVEVHSKADT